jgi:4-amino-4-deoxy-L-arabinose transferase-like glycosyltransferase
MTSSDAHKSTTALVILLTGLCLCVVILALVPPISRDALTHHLAIPKLYLQQGAIYEIPELGFSYYPMNLDLLYMIPLAFGNDIAPKLIHFAFALLTGFLIYIYLKKKLSRAYGLLGGLFFLSIPIIIKLSITVYVDLGLIFFITASLILLFLWTERKYQLRYLFASALFCGLAVGTKYNGLIALLLLSAFAPLLYSRTAGTKASNLAAIKYGALFLVTALIIAAPWFIRNYIWTSNPLFPLFDTVFNPANHQTAVAGMDKFTLRRLYFKESTLQILLLPIRIFFQGQDNSPQYFDGQLNPFLLVLPLFAFFKHKGSSVQLQKWAMLIFCVLFLLFSLFQTNLRIRYIAPIIPFLVILSIFALHNLFSLTTQNPNITTPKAFRYLATLFVMAMLFYNGHYLLGQFRYIRPLDFITGLISREAYISKYRLEYPVIQYANKHSKPDTKTLCLFLGNRGYYMEFPHIFDVPTSQTSLMAQLIQSATDPTSIQQALLQQNFEQILLRNDILSTWINNLEKNHEIAVAFFQNHLELMYSRNGYSLLRIK